ncbi:MAG: M24 family metallopeptidase, partial [Burkholderiales bacterium]|nr:M24 family metallopeptidase [Burkholderiales bacterium]
RPGMVLTLEPGCYIRPAEDIDARFHNIGIRIEDDALVTADGHDNLTAAAPKSVADIGALMRRWAGGKLPLCSISAPPPPPYDALCPPTPKAGPTAPRSHGGGGRRWPGGLCLRGLAPARRH